MIEASAHLVDHVIPPVPTRQWVLTFPWPLRLLFASQPDTLSRVLAVVIRAIETDLIHRAGLTRRSCARTGVVTLIQRFGSALNLNVHLHMIVLDGVYTEHRGQARFHPVGAPSRGTLERLLDRLIKRALRVLLRDGALREDPEHPWLDLQDPDTLDQLNAASVRYRIAIGPGAGQRTFTLRNPALAQPNEQSVPKPFNVNRDGFSLNAAVAVPQHRRDRLEHLCRYITRPAICLERLSLHTDGRIRLRLKRPFRDGTTHLLFTPADFIARLAALIPRPRHNLTRYHGVFAPSAPLRRLIVPTPTSARKRPTPKDSATAPANLPLKPTQAPIAPTDPPTAPLTWAQRLKRVFEIDITLCPLCGGQLRVIADITEPELITKILDHIQNRDPPRRAPRRALPHSETNDLFDER